MSLARPLIEQTDSPRSPKETLPTMCDLILTDEERKRKEKEAAQKRAEILAERLRRMGVNPDEIES